MATHPKVSAIIISYNRSDDLRKALEALVKTGYANLEVVVFDNASTDDSASVTQAFPGVRLIRSDTNRGFAQGNNAALEAASGEYIALINNDAVVEPNWVADLAHRSERRSLGASC